MLEAMQEQLKLAMQADQFRLRRRLRAIRQAQRQGKPVDRPLAQLRDQLERSRALRQRRLEQRPRLSYDEELPIVARREEIAEALRGNRVVVVCGETGSGKSTQLPKICLEVGRGVGGMIGHTQPRRIAARSLATRLSQELASPLGRHVGFKVRFQDQVQPESFVKFMTDGILLAETQGDRFLDAYDTLIIDEAHERSLNIDFLLGYLHRLLPKRPDLRLIITSATIDAERFARHFSDGGEPAPVIDVSGRAYPVETRYRPLESLAEGEVDETGQAVAMAVDELRREGRGDLLVFLPTEREIRETAKVLRGWSLHQSETFEIVPLYARLSSAEQQRVFQPGNRRRIVLATNVAESSLTVPGIRYVVDTGTARISRYSPRSQVQRLPIEPVSRASADQRQGRCGRLGPGVCIRLYSEEDYLSRDRYTTPEIRRTNLAAVILRMLDLRLGRVDQFPFLEPPRPDAVRDGYKTLYELGAIDDSRALTELGRKMSRLPVDPRIARMILAGDDENCLAEILVIAAALEIQDPRQRPAENPQAADKAHARYHDPRSDFLGSLKLWDEFHRWKAELSRGQLRKACQQNFLSLMRLREWQEVHRQLKQLVQESGLRVRRRQDSADAIHRALLTGLLSNVAMRSERHQYLGAGGTRSFVWPGSGTFAKPPRWLMAAEVVETSKRYLRTVAAIDPDWIEPRAAHLVKRSYSEPHWSRKRRTVMAYEKVTLFGLTIVPRRRVAFGPIDPAAARRCFIEQGLVEDGFETDIECLVHNRLLIEDLQEAAARSRRSRFLVSDGQVQLFYEERLPDEVYDEATLRGWLKNAGEPQRQRLFMTRGDLIGEDEEEETAAQFPRHWQAGELRLELQYRFQPGEADDGVSLQVPQAALRQIDPARLEWLVPGLLHEKVVALIRTLPKSLRRCLVPAPETAARAIERMPFGQGPFLDKLAVVLSELAEEPIAPGDFQRDRIPEHLRMNLRVVDEQGRPLAEGRDQSRLLEQLGVDTAPESSTLHDERWHRENLVRWDFGTLPESVLLRRGQHELRAYPALIDRGDSVQLTLQDRAETARRLTRRGLRRLFCLAEQGELKSQVHWLPGLQEAGLLAATVRKPFELRRALMELLSERAYVAPSSWPRDAQQFQAACEAGRRQLSVSVQEVAKLLLPLFENYHTARLQLDEARRLPCGEALRDMRQQLDALMTPDFLAETPWNWLREFPRYLRAISVRLEKLGAGGQARDQEAMRQLAPFVQRYRQRVESGELDAESDPELETYRWMLEEFRVSLFAQQLGTAVKISPQRLDRQWDKVGGVNSRG